MLYHSTSKHLFYAVLILVSAAQGRIGDWSKFVTSQDCWQGKSCSWAM